MSKKDKKEKSSTKSVSKKDSPQTIRNVRGSDPSSYVAVTGQPSDTDEAITRIPESPARSSMPIPPGKSSTARTGKEKRSKKEKKKKEKEEESRNDEVTAEEEETDVELTRKPSPVVAPLPRLTNEEYKFFVKVKSGDTEAVAAYMSSEAFQNISINKMDIKGYTVLHYAVKRQDENMVRLLLQQPGIRLYDTILHAIREKNVEITKILLQLYDKASSEDQKQRFMSTLGSSEDHSQALSMLVANTSGVFVPPQISPISDHSGIKASIKMSNRSGISSVQSLRLSTTTFKTGAAPQVPVTSVQPQEDDDSDEIPFDSEFSPVITPLMLAAQVGSNPLISLFYNRGERLETAEYTHNLGCGCDICVKLDGDQDLLRTYQRYHLFKALTNPVYICHMARAEKIDPVDYAICKIVKIRQIIKRDWAFNEMFKEFGTKLEEFMSSLLGQCRTTKETAIFLSPKDSAGKERLPHLYPRLWYAMGLRLKSFISQANFQNFLYKLWVTDDWPEWDSYSINFKLINLFSRVCGFPIVAFTLFFFQNTSMARPFYSPLSRFLTYVGSYFFFLFAVWFQGTYPKQRCNDEMPYYQIDDIDCRERGPPRIGTEWVLVVYVFSFYINMIRRNSVSWYWRMRWNWFELVGQLCFTVTFLCWLRAYLWTKMPENKDLLMATDRLMWPHDCAEILGDCFLSVSAFFACYRALRFMAVHHKLGPIQASLGKQIVDFFSIMVFMIVVIFAFISGVMGLYVPYKSFHREDINDLQREKLHDMSFQTVGGSFKAFFFKLYSHPLPDPSYLLKWPASNTTEPEIHHYYTEYTGRFLLQAYHTIGVTLVFSMLAGYFTETAKKILKNLDAEWKYARTELYLMFMKDSVMPPPFNIFPTLASMRQGWRWCSRLGHKHDPKPACSMKQCCFLTTNEKTIRWEELVGGYRKLILLLMHRYENSEGDTMKKATNGDVLEVGEELAEIVALLKKAKGEAGGPKDGGDDGDDDDLPPDGAGTGTMSSFVSGKTGWSKPKYIVESTGSTYLKNTGGGGSGGSGGTSFSNAGGGSTNSQTSTKSTSVVTAQPSSKSIQSKTNSVGPSSPVMTTGKSEQMNVLFTPTPGGPIPMPRSDSGQLDLMRGNITSSSEQEVSTQQVYGAATAGPLNYSGISETPSNQRLSGDFSQPRRGSRGGGGLEGAVGLEDFSGRGTVESAYRSSPTNGNNYMNMDPTPKKPPGLVDVTGISPPVAHGLHQTTKVASQKSPPQTSLNLNMSPSPTSLSGISGFMGASSPDQFAISGMEARRNSGPSSPTNRVTGANVSPTKRGLGSIETPQKPSKTNAFNYMDMDPTPKKSAGIVDVTGFSPPVTHGPHYASGAGSQKSPPQTSLTLNTTPSPTRPSGISGFNSPQNQSRIPSMDTRRSPGPSSPITGATYANISPTSTNQQFRSNAVPSPRRTSGLIDVWSGHDPNSNKTTGLPPTGKMSPVNELADTSFRESPDAKRPSMKYQTTKQYTPDPSKTLYSPSNSPSMVPSATTGLPTKVRSIAMHTFSSESGNAS